MTTKQFRHTAMAAKCSFTANVELKMCAPLYRASGLTRLGIGLGISDDGRIIPMLRSGDFRRAGIALAYCPFCGTSLKRLTRVKP